MGRVLSERKVAVVTSSPWKIEALSYVLDPLVGKQKWGTLEEVAADYVGRDAANNLVSRLVDETSEDLAPLIGTAIRINPNMDALDKLIAGGIRVIADVSPASVSYWQEDESCSATQVISVDTMSAYLSEPQVRSIEKVEPESRRTLIDGMIAKGEIKFNNKVNSESLQQAISQMESSMGLVLLSVVKGTSVISGIHKYETIIPPVVGRAFLYAGKWKEEDKRQIKEIMLNEGIGISSGIKSQNLYEQGLMKTVYCGRLSENGSKLKLALMGVPLDDVEFVVRRNDDNIRQEFAVRAIDVEKGVLLGDKIDPLTDAGFALARLGRHLRSLKEDGKVDIKIRIKNFSDLQDFVKQFNLERGLIEPIDRIYEKLEVEVQEFDEEAKEFGKNPSEKLRLNMAREIADVVVFLSKFANAFNIRLDDISLGDLVADKLKLDDLVLIQNNAIRRLNSNLKESKESAKIIFDLTKNAFLISKFLGFDLFDLVSRKSQRNIDKYDADTVQKLEKVGLQPFVAEAMVKTLWDKHLDEIYFL